MRKLCIRLKNLLTGKEEGASMGEYALLLGLIAVALIVVITQFRDAIIAVFQQATTVMQQAVSGS